MYPTELTHLIQKKATPKYCKYLFHTLISTVLLIITIISLYAVYGGKKHIGFNSWSVTQLFHHNQLELKNELKGEVTIDLHPNDIYYLEGLDRDSDEWYGYHSQLIENAKSSDQIDESLILYTFTMYDYHYDKRYYLQSYHNGEEEEEPINSKKQENSKRTAHSERARTQQKRTPRPTPQPSRKPTPAPTNKQKSPYPTMDYSETAKRVSRGGLTCYVKYNLNERQSSDGYVLGCNWETDTLMGCVGGSSQRNVVMRSGEKAVTHGCVAQGESVYIRCCFPEDRRITMLGAVSQIDIQFDDFDHPDPNFPVYSVKSYCHSTYIGGFDHVFAKRDHYYMVGCTGWYGVSSDTQTTKLLGTQMIDEPQMHCKARRGDKKSFIAALAIVVSVENAELDCVLVESIEVQKQVGQGGAFWSAMSFCTEGYSLMDCSGYIDGQMEDNQCSKRYKGRDKVNAVVFHGTDLKCMPEAEQHCSANGPTNKIRVQANCCKIIQDQKKGHM